MVVQRKRRTAPCHHSHANVPAAAAPCQPAEDLCLVGVFPHSYAQMYLTFKAEEQDVYRVHTDGVVLEGRRKDDKRCHTDVH